MDPEWQRTFRDRMRGFGDRRPPQPGELPLSIKLRVVSGCFHREHSPHAYQLIDSRLTGSPAELEFQEHESGPELLVYLAAVTAGVTLAKSVIDLITAIIKARSEGVKKGDHPNAPLELIVRRLDDKSQFHEEIVLRIGHNDPADPKLVEKLVDEAVKKLLKASDSAGGEPKSTFKRRKLKKP